MSKKIVGHVNVTRSMESATQNHERYGTLQLIQQFKRQRFPVVCVTHDDNAAVTNLLRREHPEVDVQLDRWHGVLPPPSRGTSYRGTSSIMRKKGPKFVLVRFDEDNSSFVCERGWVKFLEKQEFRKGAPITIIWLEHRKDYHGIILLTGMVKARLQQKLGEYVERQRYSTTEDDDSPRVVLQRRRL